MLHQISIYLTLSLNKFYQKSARKSTASGITHEKPSDVVILSAPREEERGSDDQCVSASATVMASQMPLMPRSFGKRSTAAT